MKINEVSEYLATQSADQERFILHIVADSVESQKELLDVVFKDNPAVTDALNRPNELIESTNSDFDNVYFMGHFPEGLPIEQQMARSSKTMATLMDVAAAPNKSLWLSLEKVLEKKERYMRVLTSAPSKALFLSTCVLGVRKEENGELNIFPRREQGIF